MPSDDEKTPRHRDRQTSFSPILNWLKRGHRRQQMLMKMSQPITAQQLASRESISLDAAGNAISELANNGLVYCLNSSFSKSRLYWLTMLGTMCQKRLRKEHGLVPIIHDFPDIDWDLYGSVCFSQRSAVIKTLKEPLQPATIKRKALARDPKLRMSANNVRDIIRVFLEKGLVVPVKVRRKAHRRFELTEMGKKIRELLLRLDEPKWD